MKTKSISEFFLMAIMEKRSNDIWYWFNMLYSCSCAQRNDGFAQIYNIAKFTRSSLLVSNFLFCFEFFSPCFYKKNNNNKKIPKQTDDLICAELGASHSLVNVLLRLPAKCAVLPLFSGCLNCFETRSAVWMRCHLPLLLTPHPHPHPTHWTGSKKKKKV